MNKDHTYYGRQDEVDPKHGVHELMLNEHIKAMIAHEKDKFRKEIAAMIEHFRESMKNTVNHIEKALSIRVNGPVKKMVAPIKKEVEDDNG